ncbi:hypothetical protein GCM10022248_34150 [Nonomuraea soli]
MIIGWAGVNILGGLVESFIGDAPSFTDRAAAYLSPLTSPLSTALLFGALLLVTSFGAPPLRAKAIPAAIAGELAASGLLGGLGVLLTLGAAEGSSVVWALLSGLLEVGLIVLALLYVRPLVLGGKPSGPVFSSAQPYTPPSGFAQEGFGQPAYGQPPVPGSGVQPIPGAGVQPQYGQQPVSGVQPIPGAGVQPIPGAGVQPMGGQQFGQPAYGQPAYGQPSYGQPSYDQADAPSYGQPEAPQPAFGQPDIAQPSYGQPSQAQPSYGQPDVQAAPMQPFPAPQLSPDPLQASEPAAPNTLPALPAPMPGEYTPPPYVPADAQPSVYQGADSMPNTYAPPHSQGGYQPAETRPDVYPPAEAYQPPVEGYQSVDSQPGGYQSFESQPGGGYTPSHSAPSLPGYIPAETQPELGHSAPEQQPYYTQPPAFTPSPAEQQGGQPFTGFSGHEFAQPYQQEPEPPVDPRSQQLLDAYQQADSYQASSGVHQPLRVPDYSAPQQAQPYDDPFGHPQQPSHQQSSHQAPQPWPAEQPPAESTVRLDASMYRGDALASPPGAAGDDPIDPTAIYTPDPRR